MKKEILYTYLGTNGTITSPIHLEDAYYVRKIRIIADKGMILTNGESFKQSVLVPEADVDKWKEIVNDGQM
jgi:hypothetical protein